MAHRGRGNADERLLMALACGASTEKAAQDAGVSVRTVHRRMADPKFRARLHQIRGEALARAGAMLTAASLKAVQTLIALQDANQPAAVRLGAARSVLELGMKVREVNELEQRMAELEATIGEVRNQRHDQ